MSAGSSPELRHYTVRELVGTVHASTRALSRTPIDPEAFAGSRSGQRRPFRLDRNTVGTWLQPDRRGRVRVGAWNAGRRPGRRQLANRRRHCGLRTHRGDEMLHLALALVMCKLEDPDMVLSGQVWREQTDGRQRERTIRE